MKRFLTQLQPVDFGAIAKRGCFVYCYLRADGSPYYVGIAKLANRPIRRGKADTKAPRDHSRIRVMRSGLSWDQACHWERFYIARYGRKDNGTGILRNRTDGGEGVIGFSWRPSPENRAKMSAAAKARGMPKWVGDLGRQKSRKSQAVRVKARQEALASAAGLSVEQYLEMRRKATADRSSRRRSERQKQLQMTRSAYQQWIQDGKPLDDLAKYQQRKKVGRGPLTQEERQQLSEAITAHHAAQAAKNGMTLAEQKALSRKRKYQRMMDEARSMGMTKRQHAAWVTAGRPCLEVAS